MKNRRDFRFAAIYQIYTGPWLRLIGIDEFLMHVTNF